MPYKRPGGPYQGRPWVEFVIVCLDKVEIHYQIHDTETVIAPSPSCADVIAQALIHQYGCQLIRIP